MIIYRYFFPGGFNYSVNIHIDRHDLAVRNDGFLAEQIPAGHACVIKEYAVVEIAEDHQCRQNTDGNEHPRHGEFGPERHEYGKSDEQNSRDHCDYKKQRGVA